VTPFGVKRFQQVVAALSLIASCHLGPLAPFGIAILEDLQDEALI
jgi:hypothetical protein